MLLINNKFFINKNVYYICKRLAIMRLFFIMLHYVYFDGTSTFVDDETGYNDDTEVLFKSTDMDKCVEFCEEQNDSINPKNPYF